MSPAKKRAGTIIRKAADLTWQTPEWILERVRVAFEGQIPFDPATALDNPTRAERFCAGPPGRLFADATTIVREGCSPGCDCSGCALARQNGLEVSWDWPFWVNPPFNEAWIRKIGREGARQSGYALLPVNRSEEPYFQETFSAAAFVCLISAKDFNGTKERTNKVAFISSIDKVPVASNPYGSWILGFRVPRARFVEAFAPIGTCYAHERIGGPAARGVA